jgi:hypothetical protein
MAAPHPQSSSPAKAGDPVNTDVAVITGCPAFAGHNRERTKAGDPVPTEAVVFTGSPAFAGDDREEVAA